MIAPDFPLEFAGFFPRKNPVKRGGNPVPPGKNPVKNTGFSPRNSAPKRRSSLFLRKFYVGTRTSLRPGPSRPAILARPAIPARPVIPARPAIPARPSWPAPAQRSGNYFRAQYSFFPGHTGFFPRVRERGKNSEQKEKTHLLNRSDLARRAAQRQLNFVHSSTLCSSKILLSCSLLHVHNVHNVA